MYNTCFKTNSWYQFCTSNTSFIVVQITIGNTPADVVKACDVTYSMLSTVEASISVVSELGNTFLSSVQLASRKDNAFTL